jgi:hypothetical protein
MDTSTSNDATPAQAGPATGVLTTPLDSLASTDITALSHPTLRTQLLDLHTAANRVYAEKIRHVDAFDRRHLAPDD